MNIVEIHDIARLDGMRREWDQLFKVSNTTNYFLSHSWLSSCAKEFLKSEKFVLFACYDKGDLVAAIPSVYSRGTLTLPLIADLNDYSGLLFASGREDALSALLEHLFGKKNWKKVVFGNIRSTSPAIEPLTQEISKFGFIASRRVVCPNPLVRIQGSFEDYYKSHVKKKVRQEIRTTVNHLQCGGEWSFRSASSPDEAISLYRHLITMHLDRQKSKAGRSLFENEAVANYLGKLLSTTGGEADENIDIAPHMSAIYWNDKIVSAAYSLRCRDAFYYWIPSFDNTIKHVSLGKLHVKSLLEFCFGNQFKSFDFMGGAEEYKAQWANDAYDVLTITVYRSRLQAWRERVWHDFADRLRDLKSRYPSTQKIWFLWTKISG